MHPITNHEECTRNDGHKITVIIDKATRQPISDNTITLKWETQDGKVIATK